MNRGKEKVYYFCIGCIIVAVMNIILGSILDIQILKNVGLFTFIIIAIIVAICVTLEKK